MEYNGPGRNEPEPKGLTEVRIGYFGPGEPRHPVGGTFWVGAKRAIEEANREGGYHGLPFRLVQAWSDNPWRAGASVVVRMAYTDHVWAVLAGIDGVTAHLAEQVVAKALLPLVDMGSTDKTVNMAYVPWAFSLAPDDPKIAAALGESLRGSRFILYSATDHDSRALAGDLLAWLRRNQTLPVRHVEFQPGAQDAPALAAEADAPAAVVIAGAEDSARLIRELRRVKPDLRIYGGPSIGRAAFAEARDGIGYPVLAPEVPGLPDYAAVYAYDATRLLVTAIRKAGLNRARIRDAIQQLSGWQGASGPVRWDALNRNLHGVGLNR